MPLDTDSFLPKHDAITVEDLCLLCDMFYLPYQHGSRAVELLQELSWLVNYNPENPDEETDSTLPTEWTRKVRTERRERTKQCGVR